MSNNTTGKTNPQPRLRASFDQARPQMEAIERDDLISVKIDPLTAVSTVHGALPHIMKHHDQILALPDFNPEHLNSLELYAWATHTAQTRLQAASAPPEHLREMVDESTALRDLLLNDAVALSRRGLLSGEPLSQLKGPLGFRNVASDLMTLAIMFREAWPQLVGKTCVNEAELDRAEILSEAVVKDVGLKEQAPAAIAAVALERQQAFTLFMTAYDQVRRALTYLRWNEGDADDIAPSLYAGRTASRKKATEVEKEVVPVQAAPIATTVPAATATTPAASAAKPAVGLPGADPFAN